MTSLRPTVTALVTVIMALIAVPAVWPTDLTGPLPPLPEDPRHGISMPLELSPRLDLSAPFSVEFTTTNDIISGEDDLYTADLVFTAVLDGFAITLNERMFTDRENGQRHDETVLELRKSIADLWGLDGEVALGALRVGRGLFGETFQNAVHNVFANDEVDLVYPDGTDWHASGRIRLGANLINGDLLSLRTEAEAAVAPGFRSSLAVRLTAGHDFGNRLFAEGGIGVMATHVETDRLREHVDDVVPTWSVAVGWGPMALQWSANTFGTTQRHIGLVYRFGAGGRHHVKD
jgi:hypothetical protein